MFGINFLHLIQTQGENKHGAKYGWGTDVLKTNNKVVQTRDFLKTGKANWYLVPGRYCSLNWYLLPGTRAVLQFKLVLLPICDNSYILKLVLVSVLDNYFILKQMLVHVMNISLILKLALLPVWKNQFLNWYWYLFWKILALSNWYFYLFWIFFALSNWHWHLFWINFAFSN